MWPWLTTASYRVGKESCVSDQAPLPSLVGLPSHYSPLVLSAIVASWMCSPACSRTQRYPTQLPATSVSVTHQIQSKLVLVVAVAIRSCGVHPLQAKSITQKYTTCRKSSPHPEDVDRTTGSRVAGIFEIRERW